MIFDKLKVVFLEYSKIAAGLDEDYKAYSPFLHDAYFKTKWIEFSLDDPLPELSTSNRGTFLSRLLVEPVKNAFKAPLFSKQSWKWALFQRAELQKTLQKFHKWNKKLNSLVPIFLAFRPQLSIPERFSKVKKEDDTVVAGLEPHLRLRQLTSSKQNLAIEAPPTGTSLTIASLLEPGNSRMTNEKILVEYKYYSLVERSSTFDEPILQQVRNDASIHQLAKLLSSSGKYNLHTLPFKGYLNEIEEGRYKFMFAHPEGTSPNDPVSLRDIVRGKDPSCKRLALSARFQVAQAIKMALAAFHAGRWVHKGLRSESIKFFKKDGVVQYDSPYLADFEYSRPESDETLFTYDDDIEQNVYRHPDRQGPPSVQFTKIHDIYALGVVLLEIGMWRTASTIYHEYCKVVEHRGGGGGIVGPKICREIFMDKVEGNLPHYMGRAYADAVSACLAGRFDNGISDGAFAMEFHDRVVEGINSKKI